MSQFNSPLATETLKKVILSTYPILDIKLEDKYLIKINDCYSEDKLLKVYLEILQSYKESLESQELKLRINNILND